MLNHMQAHNLTEGTAPILSKLLKPRARPRLNIDESATGNLGNVNWRSAIARKQRCFSNLPKYIQSRRYCPGPQCWWSRVGHAGYSEVGHPSRCTALHCAALHLHCGRPCCSSLGTPGPHSSLSVAAALCHRHISPPLPPPPAAALLAFGPAALFFDRFSGACLRILAWTALTIDGSRSSLVLLSSLAPTAISAAAAPAPTPTWNSSGCMRIAELIIKLCAIVYPASIDDMMIIVQNLNAFLLSTVASGSWARLGKAACFKSSQTRRRRFVFVVLLFLLGMRIAPPSSRLATFLFVRARSGAQVEHISIAVPRMYCG